MNKIKNVVFLLLMSVIAFTCVMPVNAATVVNKDGVEIVAETFIYDYEQHFILKPELQNGKTVVLNTQYRAVDGDTYAAVQETETTRVMARAYDLDKVSYTPAGESEALTGEELYNYILGLQRDVDSEIAAHESYYHYVEGSSPNVSPAVKAWNDLMDSQRTVQIDGDTFEALYCFTDEYYDTIELAEGCYDKYYLVVAVYVDQEGVGHQYSTARAYKVDANKDKCPICTVEDGKYYDSTGAETTKEKYQKDCCACKYVDGKYYDNNGQETTKDKYLKACNSCKIVNKKYYNKDGKEVTKKEYEKDCGNPDTGINNPYLLVAVVVAAGAGIAIVSKKKKYVK